MRRRLLLGLGLLLGVGVLALAALWWANAPAHRIGWRSYERIEAGMTLAEVEAVVGAEPGSRLDLPPGEKVVYDNAAEASWGDTTARGFSWVGNDGHLGVSFDGAGRVVGASFAPLRPEDPSLLAKFRRRVRL